MNTGNVYIHATALSQTGVQQVLREGSSVYIRILSQTGPHSFTASFAGGRFSVDSPLALKPGMTFTAEVALRDGKTVLMPQLSPGTDQPVVQNLTADMTGAGALTPQLSAYFTALGLVPDTTTLRLFRQMKLLGMKFDPAALERARTAGKRFPGREDEASDAALILEQKGIVAGVETVESLLDGLPFGSGQGGSKKSSSRRGKDSAEHGGGDDPDAGGTETVSDRMQPDGSGAETAGTAAAVRSFFVPLLSGTVPNDALGHAPGILSFFNTLGALPGNDSGTWMQFPFEFSSGGTARNGIFRFFTGSGSGNDRKTAIKIDFALKTYYFVLYYYNERCSKVRYSMLPLPSRKAQEQQREQLQSLLSIETEWADPSALSGFCSDEESVPVVRGTV